MGAPESTPLRLPRDSSSLFCFALCSAFTLCSCSPASARPHVREGHPWPVTIPEWYGGGEEARGNRQLSPHQVSKQLKKLSEAGDYSAVL